MQTLKLPIRYRSLGDPGPFLGRVLAGIRWCGIVAADPGMLWLVFLLVCWTLPAVAILGALILLQFPALVLIRALGRPDEVDSFAHFLTSPVRQSTTPSDGATIHCFSAEAWEN